jgi:hypothetical protein
MGKGAKVSGLQSGVDSSVELMHANSHYREDIVKFGGQNDWGEVIGKLW